jgi:hypothetical protein
MKNLASKGLFKELVDPSYTVFKNATGITEDGKGQEQTFSKSDVI